MIEILLVHLLSIFWLLYIIYCYILVNIRKENIHNVCTSLKGFRYISI